MPSRICSILDCGRVHFAKGFCERHYRQAARVKKSRASKVSVRHSAANTPNKEDKLSAPQPTGSRGGVTRPNLTSAPLPSTTAGKVAFHLPGLVTASGTGARSPFPAAGGDSWN